MQLAYILTFDLNIRSTKFANILMFVEKYSFPSVCCILLFVYVSTFYYANFSYFACLLHSKSI